MIIRQFLQKYILEVIPSIVATVVGAYIVTHYINNKPDNDKPATAVSAPATPAKAVDADLKSDDAAKKAKADAAAKAIADKQAADRIAAEKAAAAERAANDRAEAMRKANAEKQAAADKLAADKAAAEKRENKALAKAAPAAPAVEANVAPNDGPDANDLARAAIERLRAEQSRGDHGKMEQAKTTERPKIAPALTSPPVDTSAVSVPSAREAAIVPVTPAPPLTVAPLPSSTITDTPVAEAQAQTPSNRLVPPADIPSRPLDLRAKDDDDDSGADHSVTGDVVSAARSAFRSVLPH